MKRILLNTILLVSMLMSSGCSSDPIDLVKKMKLPFYEAKTYKDLATKFENPKWSFDEATNTVILMGGKTFESGQLLGEITCTIHFDENSDLKKLTISAKESDLRYGKRDRTTFRNAEFDGKTWTGLYIYNDERRRGEGQNRNEAWVKDHLAGLFQWFFK